MSADTLRRIKIKGFKSIASVDVELRPIDILIGANGSGKSNFLGAFRFLSEIAAGRLRNYVIAAGGAEKVLHFGSKTTNAIRLEAIFNAEGIASSSYELTLAQTEDDALFPSVERIQRGLLPHSLVEWQKGLEAGIGSRESEAYTKALRHHLHMWRLYHLHDTSYMRKTANISDNHFLRANCSNLPAFLFMLREKSPDSYGQIVRTVRQVAPFFNDFRLNPLQLNSSDIQLEWSHARSDQYFNSSSLSDGTLRFIALATLFIQPQVYRQSMILVDEPELGLHPRAIEVLAALIRRTSTETQVVVSTQSSLLLDYFDPEDVLVADLVEGGTQLKRLDSMRLAKWLEDYSLGQLWEKNEFGGRPVPA